MEEIEYQQEITRLTDELNNFKQQVEDLQTTSNKLNEENTELRKWNNKLFMSISHPTEKEIKQDETILTNKEIKERYKR